MLLITSLTMRSGNRHFTTFWTSVFSAFSLFPSTHCDLLNLLMITTAITIFFVNALGYL